MDRIRSILVIVDPTAPHQSAIDKAAQLAEKMQASVQLVACERKAEQQRLAWLESLAAPLRAMGIDVTTHAICGDPLHEQVLQWMQTSPADIIVKDTSHHSLIGRAFLLNTDWHLIRECPLPLLLTKATRWRAPPSLAAAIDPPHATNQQALLDRRILECALAVGTALHGSVHAAHSYFPDIIASCATCPAPDLTDATQTALDAEKLQHQTMIASLLARYDVAPERVHVDIGAPYDYLPRVVAGYQIDILVMGALSRSHVQQMIIGSTAERLLEHLPCDLLVVKAPKFGKCLPC